MKRIINTVLILAALSSTGFTLNSCQDALDIVQPGELEVDDLYTTVSNLNEALIGVYGELEPADEIYFTAVFTDEVKPGSGSGGQEQDLHRYFIDPSSPIVTGGTVSTTTSNGIWLNNYRVINRVNRLLEGAKSVIPSTPAETTQYNNILAQARALRAYCYVQLEAYFSTNMKDVNALGVILIKDIPSTEAQLPRSSNQEVYNFINEDLDYARGILPYNPVASGSRFYADKRFVNALSARFNLYRGNTALAKQYAQDVITNSQQTLTVANPIVTSTSPVINGTSATSSWSQEFYGVASSFNPYRNLWNDSSKGEILFSLNRLPLGAGASIGTRWNTNQSTLSGVPMWFLGRNLYNIINTTAGDVRRYAYVDPTSSIAANYLDIDSRNDRIIIDKYPGKTSAATRNDIKVFRLSEMYFILAESEVAAGNLTVANGLIQQVRVARNYSGTATTPVYTNAQSAYADILKERRVELALEGHRYIDLKRLATTAGVTMDRNTKDDFVTVTNLPNNSYKYTLPIPIRETSANPNVQQNPGY